MVGGSSALCMPTEIRNGSSMASSAVATQPSLAYSQTIPAVNAVPAWKPSGPSTNNVTGTVISRLIIGTKKIRIGLGENLVQNRCITDRNSTHKMAGKTCVL